MVLERLAKLDVRDNLWQRRIKCILLRKQEKVAKETDTWATIGFGKPKATAEAPDGYTGRSVIGEVLTISRGIKELVMRSATADEIHDQARKEGMLTLVEDGIFQAARGLTSIEEVLRVANE